MQKVRNSAGLQKDKLDNSLVNMVECSVIISNSFKDQQQFKVEIISMMTRIQYPQFDCFLTTRYLHNSYDKENGGQGLGVIVIS